MVHLRFVLALHFCGILSSFSQENAHLELDSPFASFVEKDTLWFSQTLDARQIGEAWPKKNLTPRGIILKLGGGYFACFDPDLLRIALIWKENEAGEYLTMGGMAPGSYRLPNRKASAGQKSLPRPIGQLLLATGLYPGWSLGEGEPKLVDPRTRSIDLEEPGLGPLPSNIGKWRGLRLHGENEVALEYEIGETPMIDRISYDEKSGALLRRIEIGEITRTLKLLNPGPQGQVTVETFGPDYSNSIWGCTLRNGHDSPVLDLVHDWESPATRRWSETLFTEAKDPESKPAKSADLSEAFVRDEVVLPLDNPWKRNVRLSGFDFFSDGRAAFSTFDGDVWIVEGLEGDLSEVSWRRVASGLHEPIALEVVADEIYVFDRNGIILLQDSDGNGEIDFYKNFCNLVAQTAETREFANDLREKPGGGFYIAKGGQVSSTRGKYNGSVVEIAKDGLSYRVVADGFRMPYIGVDPDTGLMTASDQQGNWKPATPIHVVERGEYYGFQPANIDIPNHPKVIDEPEIWIPHFANQSGASQLWLRNAQMGSLNDSLIHVGYNRPELFKVYLDRSRGVSQGAVASIMDGFPSGILKARVHPIDGTLWLTGFKIWGTAAEQISGLYRVRSTTQPCWVPEEMKSFAEGVLLRFSQPVDETAALNVAHYSVDRWNYWRSSGYGSGNYRLDGEPGQETLPIANITLSKDRKSLFVAIPDMKPCHSLRLSYRRPAITPTPKIQHAYFTIHALSPVELEKEGFMEKEIDLTVHQKMQKQEWPDPNPDLGKEVAQRFGCIACHSVDGKKPQGIVDGAQVAVGPGWKGLWASKREFTDGSELRKVDAAYLRESIIDPGRRVTKGYEMQETGVGMPSYLGVLKEYEIDSLVLYIQSLGKK